MTSRHHFFLSFFFFAYTFYHLGGEVYAMLAQKTKFPLNQCRFYGAEITCAFEYLHEVKTYSFDFKNKTSIGICGLNQRFFVNICFLKMTSDRLCL